MTGRACPIATFGWPTQPLPWAGLARGRAWSFGKNNNKTTTTLIVGRGVFCFTGLTAGGVDESERGDRQAGRAPDRRRVRVWTCSSCFSSFSLREVTWLRGVGRGGKAKQQDAASNQATNPTHRGSFVRGIDSQRADRLRERAHGNRAFRGDGRARARIGVLVVSGQRQRTTDTWMLDRCSGAHLISVLGREFASRQGGCRLGQGTPPSIRFDVNISPIFRLVHGNKPQACHLTMRWEKGPGSCRWWLVPMGPLHCHKTHHKPNQSINRHCLGVTPSCQI